MNECMYVPCMNVHECNVCSIMHTKVLHSYYVHTVHVILRITVLNIISQNDPSFTFHWQTCRHARLWSPSRMCRAIISSFADTTLLHVATNTVFSKKSSFVMLCRYSLMSLALGTTNFSSSPLFFFFSIFFSFFFFFFFFFPFLLFGVLSRGSRARRYHVAISDATTDDDNVSPM